MIQCSCRSKGRGGRLRNLKPYLARLDGRELGQGHDTYKKHFSDVSKEIVRNKTSSEKIGYTDTDLQAARESHGIAVRHVSPARHRP